MNRILNRVFPLRQAQVPLSQVHTKSIQEGQSAELNQCLKLTERKITCIFMQYNKNNSL